MLNLQAKVALLDPSHVSTIGGQLQVSPVYLVRGGVRRSLCCFVSSFCQSVLQLLEQVSEQAEKKEASPEKKTQVSEG